MLGLGGAGGAMGTDPQHANHEQLVEMVKNLQRQDPVARSQWGAFVNQHGMMMRDPYKHSAEFLQSFLMQYNSGVKLPEPEDVFSGNASISDLVKLGQKRSPHWKTVWSQYCLQYGGGTNDPSKHPADFLYSFLEHISEMAAQAINAGFTSSQQQQQQQQQPQLLPVGAGGCGTKRPRDSHLGLGSPAIASDPERDALVSQVKQIQRQGDTAKEAWSIFCDAHLGGVKDPGRHDASTLSQFLQSQGITPGAVPAYDLGGSIGAPPAKRARTEPPAAAGLGPMYGMQQQADPVKEKLVGQIKAFQRMGEVQKEQWAIFCDTHLASVKDPNRHSTEVLQQFVTSAGVPENLGGNPPSVPGMDPVKDQLVNQIKNFQRQGDDQKVMWAMFCDTHLAGVKDPSRHDAATLQEFVSAHMPALSTASGPVGAGYGGALAANAGTAPLGGFGGCGGYKAEEEPWWQNSQESSEKTVLVHRVKNFMRLSSEHFQTWSTFCAGGKRDPTLMDEVRLREFCDHYGVA